jgi:hypothetical protein
MQYCDYINSSEVWNNAPLTTSQTKWAAQTWFLTQGVNDATTAASLTKAALDKGIAAEYACTSYMALPTWLDSYITLIEPVTAAAPVAEPAPVVEPAPVTNPAPIAEPAPVIEPVTTPVTNPEPILTPAATVDPVTTPIITTDPTPAPATIASAPVTPPAESNTTGNFFTGLWQSLQGIWSQILSWFGK